MGKDVWKDATYSVGSKEWTYASYYKHVLQFKFIQENWSSSSHKGLAH